MNDYGAIRLDHGSIASQRHDLTEDTYGFVGKGFEIFGVDARSSFGGHVVRVGGMGGGRVGEWLGVDG